MGFCPDCLQEGQKRRNFCKRHGWRDEQWWANFTRGIALEPLLPRPDRTVSTAMRRRILERDDYTCHYCGERKPVSQLEVDHILPHSRGGAGDESNLVTACRECNRDKSDMTPEEWRRP